MNQERSWKKSKLEISLEEQEWTYVGNLSLFDDMSPNGGKHRIRKTPINDDEIKDVYFKRGFKEVRVEDAYDFEAHELPRYRAVYVKR